MPHRPVEPGHLNLFLGRMPIVLGYEELLGLPDEISGADSVLLSPESTAIPEGQHARRRGTRAAVRSRETLARSLAALRDRLPREASVAAVIDNRCVRLGSRLLATLRRGPYEGSPGHSLRNRTMPSAERLASALRDAGYGGITVYLLTPSSIQPEEIAPRSSGYRDQTSNTLATSWLQKTIRRMSAPAVLITANTGPGDANSLLTRILSASRQEPGHGWGIGSCRLERIVHSGKQKTLIFVHGSEAEAVIRVPLSAQAERSELHAHAFLNRLVSRENDMPLAPRPLAEMQVNGHRLFVEGRLPGRPLSSFLNRHNRGTYARSISRMLRRVNPELSLAPLKTFDAAVMMSFVRPAIDRVLRNVDDSSLRKQAAQAIEGALSGCVSRFGIVHGDFSVSNILAQDGEPTGIIDWEDALAAAPPVLDALNYLDSAHRHCEPSQGLADTVGLLASGSWPVKEELDLLRQALADSGTDFSFIKGLALLYWLFHVGPQLDYGIPREAFDRRVGSVLRLMLA